MARKKVIIGLDVLEAAERNYTRSEFIQSCRSFLTDAGFLTPKQIEVLKRYAAKEPPVFRAHGGSFCPNGMFDDWDDYYDGDPFGNPFESDR